MKIFKPFIILICLIVSLSGIAQEVQGKAYYISKTKINSNFGNRQMSETQKERVKERQNKASVKKYVLHFNNESSLYSEEVNVNQSVSENSGRGGGMRMMLNNKNEGTYYKNITTNELVAQRDIYGKQFLIKDDLKTYSWQLTDEVRTIGKYLCFKATTSIPNMNVSSELEDNTTTVTVWYTLEVPVSHGPEMFWGLPGLILELKVDDRLLLCSKIELSRDEIITIIPPKKGKKVSQKEFDKIQVKKIKEIKEMIDNRRARGGSKN